MVLTGNKCDLEDERQVTTQEAQNLGRSWNVPFHEASALARINVEETFFDLVREIRKTGKPVNPTKGGKPTQGGRAKPGCALF